MNLQLPDDLNEFVQQLVSSGAYGSANDVIIAALRLLRDQRERQQKVHR